MTTRTVTNTDEERDEELEVMGEEDASDDALVELKLAVDTN